MRVWGWPGQCGEGWGMEEWGWVIVGGLGGVREQQEDCQGCCRAGLCL